MQKKSADELPPQSEDMLEELRGILNAPLPASDGEAAPDGNGEIEPGSTQDEMEGISALMAACRYEKAVWRYRGLHERLKR